MNSFSDLHYYGDGEAQTITRLVLRTEKREARIFLFLDELYLLRIVAKSANRQSPCKFRSQYALDSGVNNEGQRYASVEMLSFNTLQP